MLDEKERKYKCWGEEMQIAGWMENEQTGLAKMVYGGY